MEFGEKYLIVRANGGELRVIHTTDNLKRARYWLRYIGKNQDALLLSENTPVPSYVCHLNQFNKIDFFEEQWCKENQVTDFTKISPAPAKSTLSQETLILDLSKDNFSQTLDDKRLSSLSGMEPNKLLSLFSKATNNKNFSYEIMKQSDDVHIVSLNSVSNYPLTLRINASGDTLDYGLLVSPRGSQLAL